jgi:Spy/CpxP family protein refolding chaperone
MRSAWLGLMFTGIIVAGLAAQGPKDNRLEKAMFDPQLVLERARDIGLTGQQRSRILDAIKTIQTELVPLQLEMTEPALDLLELVEQPQVNEAASLAKADQVLAVENRIKRLQMALLIRIKNVLTPDQQNRLRALRDGARDDERDDTNRTGDDAP